MKNIINKLLNIISNVIYIASLVLLVNMVLFFLGVNHATVVSRGSGPCMKPNIPEKSIILYTKTNSFSREDIVNATPDWGVEKTKSDDFGIYAGVIKRIIGMPGEHIEYKYSEEDNCYRYFINDEKYNESFETINQETIKGHKYDYLDITLGEDEYFLAGDNRGNSGDSRCYGPVKKEDLKSKVIFSIDLQPAVDFIDGAINNITNVISNIRDKAESNKTISIN